MATDLNTGDTLTYELDDPSDLFDIDSVGQIAVSVTDPPVAQPFDYETGPKDYSMDVTVEDRTTGGLEDKIEVKVLVTNVNEPPTVAGDVMLSYPEDTATTRVLHRYSATDPERGSLSWTAEGTDSGDFTIDARGNLRFASQPDHEDKASYSITIVATDDGDPEERGELEATVTVTDVDEPPVITGTTTITDYDENSIHPFDQYSARDPEDVPNISSWSLSGTHRNDFSITSSGQLQFASPPDFERPADSGRNYVYKVTVRANDGSLTGTLDVTVTVDDVNEAPSGPSGDAEITVAENATSTLDRYSSTDPERGQITWSVGGADADDFRIDISGNLSFDGAPDYEVATDSGGDNVYDIQVVATDDGSLGDCTPSLRGTMSASFGVTVTVTPVDEPPVITGTTTFNHWQENDGWTIHTYMATDPEGSTPITWSLRGTDRADFEISNTGDLTFKTAPDYERPADSGGNNHDEVTVQATDSNYKRGDLHVDVIVQNVDEPPVLVGPDTVDDFPKNSSTSRQVGRYTASDPEGLGLSVAAVGRRQVRDGQSVGFRFTARHPDNVNMTYRVGGDDRQFFMVDSPTGQLKTSDIPVDRETLPGSEAEVVITVTAPDNHTAATTVAVTIIDE